MEESELHKALDAAQQEANTALCRVQELQSIAADASLIARTALRKEVECSDYVAPDQYFEDESNVIKALEIAWLTVMEKNEVVKTLKWRIKHNGLLR